MIQLYDTETGAAVGAISQEQLRFLISRLEEESLEDQDYYINVATLDWFESEGADPALLATLRQALGNRQAMELRWGE